MNEDSIQRVIRRAKEDTTRVDAMLAYARYVIKHKMDNKGLALLNDARKLAQTNNYFPGLAQVYLILGNFYNSKSEWQKAIEYYDSILKIAPHIPDEVTRKKAIRNAYNNTGNIYNINGDFTSSLEYRLKAAEVTESMPSPTPHEMAIVYTNAASDYRQLKEMGKAKEYLNKVTPLFSSLNDNMKLEYYYEYYQIYIGNGEIEKARQLLRDFDNILQNANLSDYQKKDFGLLSRKLHGLYEMEHSKNYKNALAYFQASLPMADDLGETVEIVAANYHCGWALFELKRYADAVVSLRQSYTIAIENDLKNQALKAANLLAQAYEKTNNIKPAFEFSRIALALQDSVVREEANKQLNFLDAKYQNEKKERAIATLQKDNQAKEFMIRRKNLFITVAIILTALLGTLGFIMFRYLRNRQRVASLQSMINGQETERTRIARDLHDGLGGMFSTVKMLYSTLQQETPAVKDNPIYRKTLDLINNASDELRKVAHNMMPEVLMKVGLTEALQDFCNNINAGKLLNISLQTYGMEKRLNGSTEVMLYRIIQELVNNIIKHASATEAIIQINRQGNRLHVTIEDNGKGFDTKEAEARRSMGMNTVKSRVDYLNGRLTIDSRKNIGTTVMIDLLLNEN